MNFTIRKAVAEDMPAVHGLVCELAAYERAPEQVKTSAEEFVRDGFGDRAWFDCLVAVLPNGQIIGFALFYTNYSTWKGKCLYLEDFIVSEEFRGIGAGKALFEAVVEEAKRRKVRRMDWQVLEWNEPAIHFYKKYDAILDPEWLNGRFIFD
jgi:GNAT superfamily N-acetyltransferase